MIDEEGIKYVSASIEKAGGFIATSIDGVLENQLVTEDNGKTLNIVDALLKIEQAFQGTQDGNTIADALFDIAKAINKLASNIEKVGDIGDAIEKLTEYIDNKKSPAEIKEKQVEKHYREISECYKKGQCECGAKLDNGNRIIDLGYETGFECNKCR